MDFEWNAVTILLLMAGVILIVVACFGIRMTGAGIETIGEIVMIVLGVGAILGGIGVGFYHGDLVDKVETTLAPKGIKIKEFADFDREVVITRDACTVRYRLNVENPWPLVSGSGKVESGDCPEGQDALDSYFHVK